LTGLIVLWRSVKENLDFGASYFNSFEDGRVFLRKNYVVLKGGWLGKSFCGAEMGRVSSFFGKRGGIWVVEKVICLGLTGR
jgi:hypothetical protein